MSSRGPNELIASRVYQEYLAKGLTDKYGNLSNQMDKMIHDANSEIVGLRDKVSGKSSSNTAA